MTESSILETRYCGTMKFEVAYQGTSSNGQEWFYKIKAKFGAAPIYWEHLDIVIPATQDNPMGKDAITLACNQFIAELDKEIRKADKGEVEVLMSAETIRLQVYNILCQNVEGILQPDQPKWLITEREL
jgi:hypothetical protein